MVPRIAQRRSRNHPSHVREQRQGRGRRHKDLSIAYDPQTHPPTLRVILVLGLRKFSTEFEDIFVPLGVWCVISVSKLCNQLFWREFKVLGVAQVDVSEKSSSGLFRLTA